MPKLPTGIDRLPSGKYRVRVVTDGKRTTRTATTVAAARRLRAEMTLAPVTGTGTVAELLDQWLGGNTRIGHAAASNYQSIIANHILPDIGGRQYAAVTAADLDWLYIDLAGRGVSVNQIRRAHNIISQAFQRAAKWHLVPYSPAAAVSPPAAVKHELSPPDAAQIAALIDAASDTHVGFGMFIRFGAVTGARRGELVALRGDDIDLDAAELVIRRSLTRRRGQATRPDDVVVPGQPDLIEKGTKTGRSRRLALDAETITALRAHRRMLAVRALSCGASLNLEDHRWFSDDPAAVKPWHPRQPTAWWAIARNKAGLPHVRLHDLRHFAATQMLAAGVDVRTTAGRLGHANASMTLDRYSHVIPAADRKAADILGKIVGG